MMQTPHTVIRCSSSFCSGHLQVAIFLPYAATILPRAGAQ